MAVSRNHITLLTLLSARAAHGGRYSNLNPGEITTIVAPLVVVGVIFLIMMALLFILLRRKQRPLCPCICCKKLISQHTHMTNGDNKCPCVENRMIVASDKVCDTCARWQAAPRGWLNAGGSLDQMEGLADDSNVRMSSGVRMCKCSADNNCGSPSCHVMEEANSDTKDSGIVLSLTTRKLSDTASQLLSDEVSEEAMKQQCPCPCVMRQNGDTSCACACTISDSTQVQPSTDNKAKLSTLRTGSHEQLLSQVHPITKQCHCASQTNSDRQSCDDQMVSSRVRFDTYTATVTL